MYTFTAYYSDVEEKLTFATYNAALNAARRFQLCGVYVSKIERV